MRDRRPRGDHALQQQLPGPEHPPAAAAGRTGCRRALRRGIGGRTDHRRHDDPARGAGVPPGRLQAHRGGPDLPVRLHREHGRHPDPCAGGRRRSSATRSTTPASSTASVSPRPSAGSSRTPTSMRSGTRCATFATPMAARTRRSSSSPMACSAWTATSPAARDRRGCGGGGGDRHGRRRACLRRPGPQRARHRRPLRSPRARPGPGRHAVEGDRRAGRLRRRPAALRTVLEHRARPFLFSTSHPPAVVAACLAAIDVLEAEPELIERLWENTRHFKAGLERLGFDTGIPRRRSRR